MQDYILIVEDDNDINHMLQELLQNHGYKIEAAFSGTEALLYIEREAPMAVILDLMLPGMTGEELLQRIKGIHAETSVIVASAKDSVHTRVDLLRAGADDYIVKPFDTEELLARLEAVLRRNHQKSYPSKDTCLTYKDIVMEPEDFRITVSGKENLAVLSISNKNSDIEEKDIERIFERFYTTDQSRTRKTTGLGLAIVKRFTNQMGGNVKAYLQNDRFTIEVSFMCIKND